LAAGLANLGRTEEARAVAAELIGMYPSITIAKISANGTVRPSICRLPGAHSRAISTMSVVSDADVFGLTRTIRFMKAVPAERAAALHFCGCGPGLSLLGQSAHESGYPPSRRDKKGGDETPIAKSPRR
jgi:hypothetical protein